MQPAAHFVKTRDVGVAGLWFRVLRVGYHASTKCPAFWSCLDSSELSVFVIAGEMCEQKYEQSVIAGHTLLSGNLWFSVFLPITLMWFTFFSIHTVLTFHSSQGDTHMMKGEISSGYLQNISNGIEMVNKKQPTYYLALYPWKLLLEDEAISIVRLPGDVSLKNGWNSLSAN